MGLNRVDVIKQINLYSSEDNKNGLIELLCDILNDNNFKNENADLIELIISIGELYGYYSYMNKQPVVFSYSEVIRKNMYKGTESNVFYNSGQLSLLNEIKNEEKLFISAPTTFGKTKIILEYIIAKSSEYNNILFLVPTNSLSEEIYIKLLNFNHENKLDYYITTNPKFKKNRNILILTPEKYLLFLESKNVEFDLYIMDESYKIQEENKNVKFDDPLNSRSSKFRRIMDIIASKKGKTIYLSPYTYITDGSMDRFLNKYNITKVNRKERYVNKKLYKIDTSSDYRDILHGNTPGFLKRLSGIDKACFIVEKLSDSTIVYVRYPKEALDFIKKAHVEFNLSKVDDRFNLFLKHIEDTYESEESKWYVHEGLKKGIGVYVSPMPRYIKREIVNLFNKGILNILVVTSAFAEGVNSSAKNIIITNDVLGSNIKMTSLDLLNLSGRAGRFGVHSQGNIYSVKEQIYDRLKDCIDSGVKIYNSNYESVANNNSRSLYDIEQIDNQYLNSEELNKKNKIIEFQANYNLTDDDLKIALSISNYDKIKLYSFFVNNSDNKFLETRNKIIDNLSRNEKKDIVSSMEFIFNELSEAQINIVHGEGDIPAFSKDNEFLWGKFYGIHSSGNIKEILKKQKEYINKIYNLYRKNNEVNIKQLWINEFITDGKVDDFKLYNHAFKFISNIIEYRIPFYIGFYVSIFKLYCRKKELVGVKDYDIIEISNTLENKTIDERYDNLLEFGFSLDMVKKIQLSEGTDKLLDDYEKLIYEEYNSLF